MLGRLRGGVRGRLHAILFFFLAFAGSDMNWLQLAAGDLLVKSVMAAVLLALVFAAEPLRRRVMLRPRPPYLPHPCRKLRRLRGVIRPNLRR